MPDLLFICQGDYSILSQEGCSFVTIIPNINFDLENLCSHYIWYGTNQ